jgi:hypothetical protein
MVNAVGHTIELILTINLEDTDVGVHYLSNHSLISAMLEVTIIHLD